MRKPGKQTLAAYSRIVDLWHPSKNGDVRPENCKHGSGKRVWLQCHGCPACGEVHEWNALAHNLTSRGGEDTVCPACDSRVSFCSCRSVATDERLVAEWHEDNPPPAEVALGSNVKQKWRCSKASCQHVWISIPNSRSSVGTNCPECSRMDNKRGKHKSLDLGRPDLSSEWDEMRNGFPATSVTCGSGKLVWWVCKECGGSWQARVAGRAICGCGCPSCCELSRGKARTFTKL
jgi:hypothetical protein